MKSTARIKRLTLCAMLIAISVVIGIICKVYLTFGSIRITFENYGILLVAYIFGPIYGLAAGLLTDLISSFITGQAFNPVICLGAGAVGAVCGLLSVALKKANGNLRLFLSVMLAHAVGNMLIKSLGLHYYFGFATEIVLLRVPVYLIIGICEVLLLKITLTNKEINKGLEALK